MTPNTIQFRSDNSTEVLRLSKEGIWANPDIPADEAAKLVLAAIDHNIKVLVEQAVNDKLDEIADKLQQDFKQSFGQDTCASWASWLRSQK